MPALLLLAVPSWARATQDGTVQPGDWVLSARTPGVPLVGLPFEVDLSKSSVGAWENVTLRVTSADASVTATQSPRVKHALRVISTTPGLKPLRIEAADERGQLRAVLMTTVDIAEAYELVLASKEPVDVQILEPGPVREYQTKLGLSIVMSPMGDGVHRWVIDARRPAKIAVLEVRERSTKRELLNVQNLVIREGTWAIEVRDGEVVGAGGEGITPYLLEGPWVRFEHTAPDAFTVHLEGDMTGWASPGASEGDQSGLIPLIHRTYKGVFSTTIRLPDWAYGYRFRVDGARVEPDRNNPRAATNERGEVCGLLVVGPTADTFAPVRSNHIEKSAIGHDPAARVCARLFDASTGLVEFALRALPADATTATLHVRALTNAAPGEAAPSDARAATREIPMKRTLDAAGFDRWSARANVDLANVEYWFVLADGEAKYETPVFTPTKISGPGAVSGSAASGGGESGGESSTERVPEGGAEQEKP